MPHLLHAVAVALAAASAIAAASVASEGEHQQEQRSCAVKDDSLLQTGNRGPSKENLLLQVGSTASLKDNAAAEGDSGFCVHLFNSSEALQNPDSVVVRPLFKKTYRCLTADPTSCEECSEEGRQCFRTRKQRDGIEYLHVRTSGWGHRRWKHHRIRVNFHCPEAAQFTISVRVELNGWFNSAFMNIAGQPAFGAWRHVGGFMHSGVFTKPWNSTEGRVLELDLHFVMYGPYGWAKVRNIQIQASSRYVACQDHKTCLGVLADSEKGLTLRNDNFLQLLCLEGELPNHTACSRWRACLDGVMSAERIRTLLLAAGVNRTRTVPVLSEAGPKKADVRVKDEAEEKEEAEGEAKEPQLQADGRAEPPSSAKGDLERVALRQAASVMGSCIDPRIDDPESWLCSCLDRMEETCLAVSNAFRPEEWSSQRCLTAQMCVDPLGQVCGAWKEAVGCNGTEYARLKEALVGYISGTGPAPGPAPTSPPPSTTAPPAAPTAAAALLVRAQGRAGRAGLELDASLGGKASVCE